MPYKSSDIYQLRRWIAMDELFRRRPYKYSRMEMDKKLNEIYAIDVSRDTFYKDINSLNSIFNDKIQIINDLEAKKWHYEDHRQSILNYSIDKDTSNHLRLLLKLIKDDLEQPVFEKTKNIIDAICNYENNEIKINEDNFINKKLASVIYNRDVPENQIFFDRIFSAISTQQAINISYKSFNNPSKIKKLSPLGFKRYYNNWYFIARDHSLDIADNPRIYKLAKVEQVELLDGEYLPLPNFSLKDFFKYSIGIIQINNLKPIDLKIEINQESKVTRFCENPFVEEVQFVKKTKDHVIAKMKVIQTDELINELFNYGNDLKILSPNSLIKAYTKALNERIGAYV